MEAGLTVFDWVVISVIGLSALLALFRGFIREVLSLAAWLVAAAVTINYFDEVTELLKPHISSKVVASALATIGTFLGVLLLVAIVNSIIMRFLRSGGDISILDSALGMVFGILRGTFILSLAYLMFSVVLTEEEYPDWIKEARTRAYIEGSARILAGLAPNYVNNLSELSKQAKEKNGEMQKLQEQMKELDKMQKGGKKPGDYGEDKRKELERLLDSLEREKVAL